MHIPEPMKAQDLTPEADLTAPDLGLGRFFTGDRYVMEPKLDGCRIVLELDSGGDGNRVYSRGRNVSGHFPHLQAAAVPGLDGVMLDGELLACGPDGHVLSAATALLVSSAANAVAKQRRYGEATVAVFDLLAMPTPAGCEPVSTLWMPYSARRSALEVVVVPLAEASCGAVELVPSHPASAERLADFRSIEGFMIKDTRSPYLPGSRSGGGWWKHKHLSTCEAFITGFKPGENSLSGLVGSVTLSLREGGTGMREVATVGVFTAGFRREISAADGTLKPEYFGKVVEFACQCMGTKGMARHPRFIRLRPDKTMADCTLEQLDAIPVG